MAVIPSGTLKKVTVPDPSGLDPTSIQYIRHQKWLATKALREQRAKASPREVAITKVIESYRKRIKNYYPNAVFETEFVLGCTIPEWVSYVESTWQPGMTWEDKTGKWRVKSKRPIDDFNMSNPTEFYAFFHYTNQTAAWNKPKGFIADGNLPSPLDRDGNEV